MLENVNMVGARAPTNGNTDEDYVLVSKKEYSRLKKERDEYRAICHDFAESVPRFHEIQDNIEAIIAKEGGALE